MNDGYLEKLNEFWKLISSMLDWVLVLLFFTIIVLTILQVILRYFFSWSITGSYEMTRFLFIYTSTLGAAVLLSREEHVQVGLVVNLMPPLPRKISNTIKHLLLLAVNVYLIYLSLNWVQATGNFLSNVLRIPLVFIKIGLPIGFTLSALYELGHLFNLFQDGEQ